MAVSSAHLQVEVLGGPDRGRRLRYRTPGSITLGRAGTPDLESRFLTDTSILERHLRVTTNEFGEIHVAQLGPEGSSRIGGRSFHEARISNGALVEVGEATLRFWLTGSLVIAPNVPRAHIADYEIVEEIGQGAFSRVYEAIDLRDGKTVALKRLRLTETSSREKIVSAFLREIHLAASLDHPGVAKVLSAGRSGEDLFFTMELVDGPDLDTHVRMRGPLQESFVRRVGCEVLKALAHAHSLGLVHRDLKPSNVMLRDDGRRLQAVLVDFGLAVEVTGGAHWGLTRTGDFRGTPDFTAPECLFDAKRHSVRGDVFGVGATLYFALTGRTCRGSSDGVEMSFEELSRVEVPPLATALPSVDPRLASVIDRSLAREPSARWKSADAMRDALRQSTSVEGRPQGVRALPILPVGPAFTPLMH